MHIPIYQVDAFTDEPFQGNPAAVCLLDGPADERWMQNVAAEMNLSETAFLHPEEDGYRLRWFTPAAEVELCGHATLASAHTLFETGLVRPDDEARFYTLSGLLTARLNGDEVELNFPATPAQPSSVPPGMLEAVGAAPRYVGKNAYDYLLELATAQEVRDVSPSFARLKALSARGVMVTAVADSPDYDFVSRFFAPAVGIDEDPVTGSAHCTLGPFWGERLGKTEMLAYQASARGGIIRVRLEGARVALGGRAVTMMRGEWLQR
jgi:predicted PhzF superfamily epimerase YddE/YHI9